MQYALSFEYSVQKTCKRSVDIQVDEAFFAGICARYITETYYFAYTDPRWHETLQYFIASITISSKLSIHVTISAIAIIEHYQAARASHGENMVAGVDEACRLFLGAYMTAASQLYNTHPMDFWKELTCSVYTIQELQAMKDEIRSTAEHDDALNENTYQETVNWIIFEYLQTWNLWARDEKLKGLEHMAPREPGRFARKLDHDTMVPLDLNLYHKPRPRS